MEIDLHTLLHSWSLCGRMTITPTSHGTTRVFTSSAVATETQIIEGGVTMESKEEEISVGAPASHLTTSLRRVGPLLTGPVPSLPYSQDTTHTSR